MFLAPSEPRRIAVDFKGLDPYMNQREGISVLENRFGFKPLGIDNNQMMQLAAGHASRSSYKLGALMSDAMSHVFDCSSFTKWIYAQRGIRINRKAIDQRRVGVAVSIDSLQAGDLVFADGKNSYYDHDPNDAVGHVAIVNSPKTLLHATLDRNGVIEEGVETFIDRLGFRGIRRLILHPSRTVTFQIPFGKEIEISNDVIWLLSKHFRDDLGGNGEGEIDPAQIFI